MWSRFSCKADEFCGIGVNAKQPFGERVTEEIICMYVLVCVNVRAEQIFDWQKITAWSEKQEC